MAVTNITGVGRFEDGTIQDGSGETVEGNIYFLGYDFVTAIEPGTGPILEIEVEFNENLNNSSIVFMINTISAGDVNAVPVTILADNFGQFSGYLNTMADGTVPQGFQLNQNYPNPFNPSTIISYSLPYRSEVKLNIYDMNGKRVNSLINQIQEAGMHNITWKAIDFRGNPISAGVYLYKLEAAGKVFTEKMVYMK
jgi:hypothetical protein